MPLSPKSKRLLVKAMRAGRKHGPALHAASHALSAASALFPHLRGPARLLGRVLHIGGVGSQLLAALRGKGGKRRLASGATKASKDAGKLALQRAKGERAARLKELQHAAARARMRGLGGGSGAGGGSGGTSPPPAPAETPPSDTGGLSDAERKHLEKQFGKQGAADIERMMGKQGAGTAAQSPTPRKMPTGGPPAPDKGSGLINPVPSGVPGIVSGAVEIPEKAAPKPLLMPSAERRTPTQPPTKARNLPAQEMPPTSQPQTEGGDIGGEPTAPPKARGQRRRVPWTGWQSQLRDQGGRWTGEQWEGAGGGESAFGGQGGGEEFGKQIEKFGDIIDQFDEVVKKLSDTADQLSDVTDKLSSAADKLGSASEGSQSGGIGGAPQGPQGGGNLESAEGFGEELSEVAAVAV